MVHRKGSLNLNADVLSHGEFLDEPTAEDLADFKQNLHKLVPNQTYEEQLRTIDEQKIAKIYMLSTPWELDINRAQIVQARDDSFILKQVKDWVRNGVPPPKTTNLDRALQEYERSLDLLSIEADGCLMID